MFWKLRTLAACAVVTAASSIASADTSDWQLSEVFRQGTGISQVRFIELENKVGGCLFPTSALRVFDASGQLLGIASLTTSTTCFDGPAYRLLATQATAEMFSVPKDGNLLFELPLQGQACFVSSQTIYDCVRWGAVTQPIVDLFGSQDTTTVALATGISRVATTHIVSQDWVEQAPSPRQPNDGTIIVPPDAGVGPDAAIPADAGPIADAGRRIDATPRPDAGSSDRNDRYLDLDPGGGASCSSSGGKNGAAASVIALLFAFFGVRIRKKPKLARPPT